MICGIVIGALIALLIFLAIPVGAIGPKTTHVTFAEGSSNGLPKKSTSSMKPSDFLAYINSGNRTMDDIRRFVGEPSSTVGNIIWNLKIKNQ